MLYTEIVLGGCLERVPRGRTGRIRAEAGGACHDWHAGRATCVSATVQECATSSAVEQTPQANSSSEVTLV